MVWDKADAAALEQRRAARVELPVGQLKTCGGEALFEAVQTFACAVVVRHHRAKESDPAVACRNDGFGHLP